MPDLEVCDLYNKAVVWDTDGFSNEHGQFVVSNDAVQHDCRWDDTSRQMRNPKGQVIVVDASLVLDSHVNVGALIFRGELMDLANLEDVTIENVTKPPTDLATLWEVVALDETPDLRNRATERVVGLARYSDDINQASTTPP